MRRWIAQVALDGDGTYWRLYEGTPGIDRTPVASVCKFDTRWRGYVHAQRSPDGSRDVTPSQRSLSQDSAQAAARWVVERLGEQASKSAGGGS